jgi:hypothetical protein
MLIQFFASQDNCQFLGNIVGKELIHLRDINKWLTNPISI